MQLNCLSWRPEILIYLPYSWLHFSSLTINDGYFRIPYVLLENLIERSLLLKHWTEKKKSILPFALLYRFSHSGKLPNGWLCLKSLCNALHTLDHHWLRHVCLCIVLLAPFLKKNWPLEATLALKYNFLAETLKCHRVYTNNCDVSFVTKLLVLPVTNMGRFWLNMNFLLPS